MAGKQQRASGRVAVAMECTVHSLLMHAPQVLQLHLGYACSGCSPHVKTRAPGRTMSVERGFVGMAYATSEQKKEDLTATPEQWTALRLLRKSCQLPRRDALSSWRLGNARKYTQK